MSDSVMNKELREMLGISSALGEHTNAEQNPADAGDFDEFKDEPRPDVKFELVEKETSVPDLQLSDAKVDYAYARSMNYTLLNMTTQALARALQVVNETEHPRAFESFNSLATTVRGLTQDLLALQKVYKEVTKGRTEMEPPPPAPTTNVNISLGGPAPSGTTNDVLKLLQESIDNGSIKPIAMNGGVLVDEEEDEAPDGDNSKQ